MVAQGINPSGLAPIKRERTLGEHAYDRLKQAMMTGAFRPSEKITVRAIADALNVSITPARDAITRLITEGALEARSSKTVIVPPLTPDVLDEVTKLRVNLEGMAAEAATQSLGPSDVTKLEKIQDALEEAMANEDYRTVLNRNEDFHFLIYNASNMPRLITIIESLWLRIGPSLNLLYPDFAISRKGVSNHRDLIQALRKGDAAKVRVAIENDIRAGYASLERLVTKQFAV